MISLKELTGSYLHNHTMYSNLRLLDSINKPDLLIEKAYELGAKGVAITEHECLSSHVKALLFYKDFIEKHQIKNDDFKLILGNEIYLVDDIKEMKTNFDKDKQDYWHFILLAKDKRGYHLIKRASSTAWNQSYKQRRMERTPIEKGQLKNIIGNEKGHLIASTACIGGELGKMILKRKMFEGTDETLVKYYNHKIKSFIDYCVELFGKDDFYLEIQPSFTTEQVTVNKAIKDLAKEYGLKIIVTTDSHYLNKEDRTVHKAYLNSKDGDREVDSFYATTYMMPFDEIYDYLKDIFTLQEYKEILDNTNEISGKCEFYDLFHKQVIPEWQIKDDLKRIKTKYNDFIDANLYGRYENFMKMFVSAEEQNQYFAWKCYEGLQEKVVSIPEKRKNIDIYLEKLDIECRTLLEISPILEQNMAKYYNTIKFIMDLIWEEADSIIAPGRGSANGFLGCYLMDITQDDPVIYGLPSWRHLDATRPELPRMRWAG